MPWWQSGLVQLLRIFQAVIRDLRQGLMTLRAMSLVYTTLLSLVPLLAVSFSVLKGFGVHNKIEPTLLRILSHMGEKGVTLTEQIIGFVDNIKVGILGFVGILLLFYTVISLVQKIERAFNSTWRITSFRSLGQRFSDYLSVIMVGPVLVFTAMGITATISSHTMVDKLSAIAPLGTLISLIASVLPYLLIIAAFTFIYVLVPNTKVKLRSAMTGGLIAGILWETTGMLFASFVANSSNYTAVYSGFAILIIFMIWLYLSWMILLIGSSIAFYHQNPDRISDRQQQTTLSGRVKEKIALSIMVKLGKHFHEGEPPWTLDALVKQFTLSADALLHILKSLQAASLITRNNDEAITYIPNRSIENINLIEIIDAVRAADETSKLHLDDIETETSVNAIVKQASDALTASLKGRTLRDLIEQ